jgi:hypothetical protein
MKPLNTPRILKIRPRTIVATASLLAVLLVVSVTAGAAPADTIMEAPKPAPTTTTPQPNAATAPTPHNAWKSEILRSPAPKQGCFKTTEPSTEWQEVPCGTAPEKPYPPSSGTRPDTVGNGSDFSAQVTGTITSAVGSFDSVTGVVNESDGTTANTFSLQLNTNTFSSPACNTAKTPASCAGWEQFVYSNAGVIFTQYWLLNYVNTCPSGWNTYQSDCWRNASNATSVPVQSITNLKELSVTGKADQNGQDTAIMTVGSTAYTESNPDSALNLAAGWKLAEFNVFGDCCSSQANFNSGSTVVVRTEVSSGTTNAPACSGSGFTGETNNLTISSSCTVVSGAAPAIVFTESLAAIPDFHSIWIATGVACSGSSCPGWNRFDNNGDSVRIMAAGSTNLYQLHDTGKIWRSTGAACAGDSCPGWQMLDDNGASIQIAAGGNDLYQLHNTGKIWKFSGQPCNGNSCPGWQMLDDNAAALTIVASTGGLYQLHNTGKIWKYTGQPCNGNSCPGWQMLDDNAASVQIVAAGSDLYQLHNTGKIWKYTGQPCNGNSCPGWQMLDDNAAALTIVASTGGLYQLHNTGKIWKYTGTPCSGNSCPGWQMLDDNAAALSIRAGGNSLYQLHNTGKVWKYTGTPCSGNSCPGWQMLDDNGSTGRIAASDTALYQIHEPRTALTRTRTCYDCR